MHYLWSVETTYYSIKATLLDGRVLRSRSIDGIDQEVYALLAVYQALIRTAADAVFCRPRLDMDRISFTVLHGAAADTVTTAGGILPSTPASLVGAIGRAVLAALLPERRRRRIKARTRKNPTSKYGPNIGRHPATTQAYRFHADIVIFEKGLVRRSVS